MLNVKKLITKMLSTWREESPDYTVSVGTVNNMIITRTGKIAQLYMSCKNTSARTANQDIIQGHLNELKPRTVSTGIARIGKKTASIQLNADGNFYLSSGEAYTADTTIYACVMYILP